MKKNPIFQGNILLPMEYELIIVRQNMLAELYGAHLWSLQQGSEVVQTPALTEMGPELLEKIRGRSILIVGGYYSSSMDPIIASASKVAVFYNQSDSVPAVPHKFYSSGDWKGFCFWTIGWLSIQDPVVQKIAFYLDEYLYSDPSDEALRFQNGIYVIDRPTDLEKLLTIKTEDDMEATMAKGKEKRVSNLRIAEQRLKAGKLITFKVLEQEYTAMVSIGDSPIVDTCLLLAKNSPSGMGILFRYDLASEKTLLSTRVLRTSGLDAGKLMKSLINGGGSKLMGGGSITGLKFPQDFLH